MAKRAINLTVTPFTAECPCGGSVTDTRNGAYQLDSDSHDLACDTCEAAIVVTTKTARLSH